VKTPLIDMFILDSLMISGISWALRTLVEAADAEMNDDSALREALLEAEMRREMGEISDDEFAGIEADLLARIREIKERREGGSGPLAIGSGEPIGATGDSRFQVEASVSGDFHDPADAPHTTIVDSNPGTGMVVRTDEGQQITVLDMVPGDADSGQPASLPLTAPTRRRTRAVARPGRAARAPVARSAKATGKKKAARSGRST